MKLKRYHLIITKLLLFIHFKLASLFEVEAVVKEEIVEVTETPLGCTHDWAYVSINNIINSDSIVSTGW